MLISPAKPSSPSEGGKAIVTYNKRMRATLALAALSKCRHKHAALLFFNGQLRASSTNILREPPPSPNPDLPHNQQSNAFRTSSLHAEEAALLIAGPNLPKGAILYVARVSNSDNMKPMNSHPCKRCLSKLLRSGVRRVVYTVSQPQQSQQQNQQTNPHPDPQKVNYSLPTMKVTQL